MTRKITVFWDVSRLNGISLQKTVIFMANESLQKCGRVKILGNNSNKPDFIYKEIKSTMNLGNSSYHLVLNCPSSYLLSESGKLKTYKTIIFSLVIVLV